VNIVTSRQMGKSSMVYRAAEKLGGKDYHFAITDLSGYGSDPNPRGYFRDLTRDLAKEVNLAFEDQIFWADNVETTNAQQFIRFIRDILLSKLDGKLVIILDEIDSTLKLPFTDDLFTAIRSIYTARPREPLFKRVIFCLVGVATPNELIKARRTTPYNVGRTIWLDDFDPEHDDLSPLANVLSDNPGHAKEILEQLLYWTGGHPYLTARLCDEFRMSGIEDAAQVTTHVEQAYGSLDRVSNDPHFDQILRFLDERLTD